MTLDRAVTLEAERLPVRLGVVRPIVFQGDDVVSFDAIV
jgi:hypothetical protein